MEKTFAIALVVAFGCVFWLGVNVFDGWVQRNVYPKIRLWWARTKSSLREKIAGRHGADATKDLGSARRIGKKDV